MGTERVASFNIAFDAADGNIDTYLAGLKSKIRTAVTDLSDQTSKLELFKNLTSNLAQTGVALQSARDQFDAFRQSAQAAQSSLNGVVGPELARNLATAEKSVASLTAQYNKQASQLDTLSVKLAKAGVDTASLATEQARLAADLKAATEAAALQNSKDLLGFKTLDDVKPKIAALTAAFDTLRASGKLSAVEIQAAEKALQAQIEKVNAEVKNQGTGFADSAVRAKESFTAIFASITGFLAGFAAFSIVTDHIKEAVAAAKEFNEGLTQISTITTLSKAQIDDLGVSVRELSRALGIDVVDALHQVYDIVRQGIPVDNAIEVLRTSADAAKISQTSLGDSVKLTTTLIKSFGLSTDEAGRILDIFVQASKNGGPTLTELSASLGSIAPIAKQTNTSLGDIAAALEVMTRAGVPAETAVADLQRILTKLDTATARKQLSDLGITTGSLVSELQQIGAKGIDINGLLALGLTSQKSAAGLIALTTGSQGLTKALSQQATATSEAEAALAKAEDSAAERAKRFDAALKDYNITLGESIGSGSRLAAVLTTVLNTLNGLSPAARKAASDNQALGAINAATAGSLTLLTGPLSTINTLLGIIISLSPKAAAAVQSLGTVTTDATTKLGSAVAAIASQVSSAIASIVSNISRAGGTLITTADDLQKLIAESSASTATLISDLNARAAAEIAGLDKSTAAEQDTADKTRDILSKLATDRLAIIDANSAKLLAAVTAEGVARVAAAKATGVNVEAAERAAAQAQLAVLTTIRAQYQAHYASLQQQENDFVAKINAIDATRVSFNQSIQEQLTAIRNEGLSDFDQYIAKTNQINTLLAQAQTAFEKGGAAGLALGKQYTDQAIALTQSLKKVVDENGNEVISSFDVQQTKIADITKAANQYNAALDGQKAAAEEGKQATVEALDAVKETLDTVTKQYDDLQAKVAAGIDIKITTDEASIAAVTKQIDDGIAQKEHLLKLSADVNGIAAIVDDLAAKLKAGAIEGANADIDAIKTKLAAVVAAAPELRIDTTKADAQIDVIEKAIKGISASNPTLTIDSNAPEVQKQIDALKLPTESTHTVHIVVDNPEGVPTGGGGGGGVPGFARGGEVRPPLYRAYQAAQRVQNYAGGGMVFREPAYLKVPGSGNGDTVPAKLAGGAFVVRKAASQYYGDALMQKVAAGAARVRLLASGGFGALDPKFGNEVTVVAPSRDASNKHSPGEAGYIGTDDQESLTLDIPPPTLPSDPVALKKAVLKYAFDVSYAAIGGIDGYFYWKSALRVLDQYVTTYQDRPTSAALDDVLQQARAIGLNLGISQRQLTGFDIDGRSWHREQATGIPAGLSGPSTYKYSFYDQGGMPKGSDTVNAMLTPGEFVVNRDRTAQLGAGFMHAINDIRIDRDALAGMLQGSAPPRPSRYYATGGYVGDIPSRPAQWAGGGTAPLIGELHLHSNQPLSTQEVKRMIGPVLRDMQRKDTSGSG